MISRQFPPLLIAVSLAGCATSVPPLELSVDHPANPHAPEASPQALLSPFADVEPVGTNEDSAAPAMHDHGAHEEAQPEPVSPEGAHAGHGEQDSDDSPHSHGETE